MTELLTAAQMRAIEQAAIDSGQVTGLELMERAGRGVVDAIFAEWPDLAKTSHAAVVLCGPGNNGGDGFVVARLLKDWGWEIDVFLYGSKKKLPSDARTNFERWAELGPTRSIDVADLEAIWVYDLVIDAIFGTGLSRSARIVENINEGRRKARLAWDYRDRKGPFAKLISIDVPTGQCADSGRILSANQGTGAARHGLHPELTVTFHRAKRGHYLRPKDGPWPGKLNVASIGLENAPSEFHLSRGLNKDTAFLVGAPNVGLLDKVPDSHKYSHGHALVLSGPMGRSGAARLAARAALRVGTGLVTVGAPGSAMMECACQLTAIMLRKTDGPEALAALLEDTRINAICIGPGLGLDRARALVPVVLATERRTVLDADALTAYGDDPDALFTMLHPEVVLTPHAGEFSRLFPDLAEKLREPATKGPAYSKVDATRAAAERAGCTVLFKGADTVIASPRGRVAIHAAAYDRAAPWLATAGSGDVLAGLIIGLMARGLPPQAAAEAAAWMHTEAAIAFGPGLIAEDLPEILPDIISGSAKNR